LASLDRRENNCNLCIQLRKIQGQHTLTGMQHQVKRLGQLTKMAPHNRSHAPADAIPHYRSTQHLADGEADPRASMTLTYAVKRGHVPGKMFPALLVNRLKISVLQQPNITGEALGNFL
jgi:hypothetical protein